MTQREFIDKISSCAVRDMEAGGILASVTIAQAILESGYGSSELAVMAHNLFGMKCSLSGNTWKSCWDFKSKYSVFTKEQDKDGKESTILANFRKYSSWEESVADHSLYLLGAMNGKELRYKGLAGEKDLRKAIQIIKDGGYATDVKYVDKVMSIIEKFDLTQYDRSADVKKEEDVMSNSSLATVIQKSPNHSGKRTHKIDRITPHCVVGQLTASGIAGCFPSGRGASCNYGIGSDLKIALIVDECNRSWCSSSNANDQRAVTIECASDKSSPYAFTEGVYAKLVDLCEDICRRNGKTKLLWFADKNKSLNYAPADNEMVLTVHRWFANKSCPGDWLYSRLGNLATEVTKRLGGSPASKPVLPPASGEVKYRVRKTWEDSKSQKGAYNSLDNAKKCADQNPGYKVFDTKGNVMYPVSASPKFTPYKVRVDATDLRIRTSPGVKSNNFTGKYTGKGVFTIVDEQNGWGLLKSYEKGRNGWISLEYATRV